MRKFSWKTRFGAVVLAIIGLGTLVSSAASASIPDSQGIIHGCYRASGPAQGVLIIIDSAIETCPSGYTALNWTQAPTATSLGREVVTISNTSAPIEVPCPTGKVPISGGVRWNGLGSAPLSSMHIVSSYPTATGWYLLWENTAGLVAVDAFAVCVNS